ncbi:MAG: YIP1 family protein [Gemmatimonadota bacterium]|jgi:hypothetical protein
MSTVEGHEDTMPEPENESGSQEETEPRLASFPERVAQTFFSPGKLAEGLARKPAWGLALLLGLVLIVAQTALIPEDVWNTMLRETMMARGQQLPENFSGGGTVIRLTSVLGGALGYVIMAFLFAGVVTLIFAFVMGDEGRYKQYLAILTHAWLIPAVIGLALLPLKIAQEDVRMTLNVGTFLFFLKDGYLARLASMLDLSQAWAWLVVAQGVHTIDRKRSFGSAAVVLLVFFVALSAIFAIFVPST